MSWTVTHRLSTCEDINGVQWTFKALQIKCLSQGMEVDEFTHKRLSLQEYVNVSVRCLAKSRKNDSIDGPSHTARLTSLRDQKTLCKLHMDEPGTALSCLKHSQIMGMFLFLLFFLFYSAQFCSKGVLWSQCLQSFVAAFLLWVGREGYIEVKRGKIEQLSSKKSNVFFSLCARIMLPLHLDHNDSQSLAWTTTMGIPFSYFCYY